MNEVYIFNETAKYKSTTYDNITIEWVDGILTDDEVKVEPIKQLSKRELGLKNKRKYYRTVRKLTQLVNKEDIVGYNKDNLLTADDIFNGNHSFKKSNKLVIDHKISIIYGFMNNIPAEHIADINNLRYIPSNENHSKSKEILVDELNEWIISKQKNIL